MNNQHQQSLFASDQCSSCGTHLAIAHQRGCPQDPFADQTDWRFADGRAMPRKNRIALLELKELFEKYLLNNTNSCLLESSQVQQELF
jgi:hypothetical protein